MPGLTKLETEMLDALRRVGCQAPAFIQNTGGCGDPQCYVCAAITRAERKQARWKAKQYDPAHGDDVMCACGHPYYRHFDTYADMAFVGCKYCGCMAFVAIGTQEATDAH